MQYNHSFFIHNIQRLRKEAGYTQEEVGRMLNIKRQTYSNYERGKRTPSIDTVNALARLYNLPVEALLDESFCSSAACQTTCIREFSSLSGVKQKAVLQFIQMVKHLPD